MWRNGFGMQIGELTCNTFTFIHLLITLDMLLNVHISVRSLFNFEVSLLEENVL